MRKNREVSSDVSTYGEWVRKLLGELGKDEEDSFLEAAIAEGVDLGFAETSEAVTEAVAEARALLGKPKSVDEMSLSEALAELKANQAKLDGMYSAKTPKRKSKKSVA